MRVRVGWLGLVGAVLSLAFWVIAPLTVSNAYMHSGQGSLDAVFIALSLCGIVGSFLVRSHAGWAAALMGLGVIPGVGALLIPGLLLTVAALVGLESTEIATEPYTGRHAGAPATDVARRSASPVTVSSAMTRVHSVMRAANVRPHATDMALPGRRGEILICRSPDGSELGRCQGPDHTGACPTVLDDGTVPCAGCILALPLVIKGSRGWQIPAGYRTCFLASYDIYRQPAQPLAAVSG